MDGEAALDLAVVLYAALAAVFMIVLSALFVARRKNPLVRAHNAPMLVLMSVGATFHIVSEAVGNHHGVILMAIETSACPLWGYWAPYVFGAGLFFTGLYLRLFTYTTAVSREFSSRSAARARRWRWPVALLTLFPIICIAGLATVTPGATGPDSDSGACVSERGYKIAVGAWLSACILALLTSVAVFRHGLVADIVGEIHKQVFVAVLGIIVLIAVVFVMLFAEEGLDSVANRFIATFSITTLYLWALGVLGARPLLRTFRRGAGYVQVFDEKLKTVTQPLDSVSAILERADDRDAARVLFADFIAYCSLTTTPFMDRGGGRITDPQAVAAFYGEMDYWTHRRLAALGTPHGAGTLGETVWPPLVTTGIPHTSDNIIARYFSREGAPGFVDIGLSAAARDSTTRKNATANTQDSGMPADLFADAMWWAVGMLDEFYGETYLQTAIFGRDIISSQRAPGVRLMITALRQTEARRRLQDANLTVEAQNDSAEVAVPVGRADADADADDGVELDTVGESSD